MTFKDPYSYSIPNSYYVDFDFDKLVNWPDHLTSQLYVGFDWIYCFSENIFAYDFYFYFLNLLGNLASDNSELFFWAYWFFNFTFSGFQLFWSIVLDEFLCNLVLKLPYDEHWYRLLLSSQESSLVLIYHPELILLKEGIKNSFLNPYFTSYFTPLFSLMVHDSILLPVMLFPQFILLLMFFAFGLCFYISYFTTPTKEENLVDQDYMLANTTIEAEEEIASIEDILIGIAIIFYIFGWYFYINFWSIMGQHNEFLLVFTLMPALYGIIIGIPTFLAYDFGIFFLAYLRGVGPSSSLMMELVYDYIGLIAFFIRLCVQGVRLLLMLFTYASLHDLILLYCINPKFWLAYDSIWEEINHIEPTITSVTLFFISQLPLRIAYWIYELAHVFFVVTAQFVAFFAMVLWLFFFLYTMFVYEPTEGFFLQKRKLRSRIMDDWNDLKK